eukprot:g1744.t1
MKIEEAYTILGVDSTTSLSEVKKRYRKLALKNHPDKNHGDPHATAKFQKISAAFKRVSDPDAVDSDDDLDDVEIFKMFEEMMGQFMSVEIGGGFEGIPGFNSDQKLKGMDEFMSEMLGMGMGAGVGEEFDSSSLPSSMNNVNEEDIMMFLKMMEGSGVGGDGVLPPGFSPAMFEEMMGMGMGLGTSSPDEEELMMFLQMMESQGGAPGMSLDLFEEMAGVRGYGSMRKKVKEKKSENNKSEIKIGEKVEVRGYPSCTGTVRFAGKVHYASGTFYGIELDNPKGKNNGSVKGKRYFTCQPNHGIFVKPFSIYRVIN